VGTLTQDGNSWSPRCPLTPQKLGEHQSLLANQRFNNLLIAYSNPWNINLAFKEAVQPLKQIITVARHVLKL